MRRDRTFFFGSFERLDVGANNFVNIDDTTSVAVPGQAPRTPADLLQGRRIRDRNGHVPYDITAHQFVAKLDHNVRSTQTLTFRYSYADGYHENVETWGGLVARSRGAALDNLDHILAASYQAVLSSRSVNELRFQVADRNQAVLPLDPRLFRTL